MLARLWPEERLAAVFALGAWALLAARGLHFELRLMLVEYLKFIAAVSVIVVVPWAVVLAWRAWRRRLDRRAAARDALLYLRSFPALLLILITYSNLKCHLMQLNPRLYDPILLRLDAWIHFGGGDFLGWLLGFTHGARGAFFWSWVYLFAWLPFAVAVAAVFLRGGGPVVRRTLAALGLTYLIGSFLYLATPSLGPCFVWRERFAHLAASPAFQVQGHMLASFRFLLAHPQAPAVPFFGIAAFPSLHLATTAVGLAAAWRHARPLLWLLIPWNLAIAWSTLFFGWHYAIDLYPAVLLAFGCWYLAGRLIAPHRPAGSAGAGSGSQKS